MKSPNPFFTALGKGGSEYERARKKRVSERKEGKFSNGWSSSKGNSAIIFPSVLFRGTLSQPAEWVKVNSCTVNVLKIDFDARLSYHNIYKVRM